MSVHNGQSARSNTQVIFVHDLGNYEVITTHHPAGGEMSFSSGPLGDRLIAGMHQAAAALAAAGNNGLLDHVLIEPAWLADLAAQLAPFDPLFVGVTCPLEVLEARERDRKDRTLGQARAHHQAVHAHGLYDLEVDTSLAGPEACAAQIIARLAAGGPPIALRRLGARQVPAAD